jgi:hypothetical protein
MNDSRLFIPFLLTVPGDSSSITKVRAFAVLTRTLPGELMTMEPVGERFT